MGRGSSQPPVCCGSRAGVEELHGGVQACRAQRCHLQPWGGGGNMGSCRGNGGRTPPFACCSSPCTPHSAVCGICPPPSPRVPLSTPSASLRCSRPQTQTPSTPTPTYPLLPAVLRPPASPNPAAPSQPYLQGRPPPLQEPLHDGGDHRPAQAPNPRHDPARP